MHGTLKPLFLHFAALMALAIVAITALCANAQPIPLRFGEDPSVTESKARIARGVQLWGTPQAQPGLDIRFMDLDITVLPSTKSISATAIKRFTISETVPSVRLQLTRLLDIASVLDGNGESIPYSRDDADGLILMPTTGYEPGDHSVQVVYSGTPTSTGFGSFNFGFSRHFGEEIIWTLSQPFGAQDWFPTTNDPSEKLDSIVMRITVPSPFIAVSNGLLISESTESGMSTFVWRHRYPISPYLISMAIADYDQFTLDYTSPEGDNIPIVNYVLKNQDLDQLRTAAQQTTGLMDLFWDLYGPYPFKDEKYGHAQFGATVGGMEHQTISSMGNLGFFLVAHELAHQWFGNKVTNATWSDLWIQEGMATLSEGLSLRYFLGEGDYNNWLSMRKEQVMALPGGSIYIPESEVSDDNLLRMFDPRLTYRKAALVLNMLRVHVGDENFFAGLRSYLETYSYSSASTEDFRQIMESVSGKHLGTFFAQWVYGEGYPLLNLNYRPVAGTPYAVQLDVSHVGSHESVPVFEFPLDIRIVASDRDTVFTVMVTEANQSFVLDPGFAWKYLLLDPHANLLFRLQSLTSIDEPRIDLPSAFTLEPGYPNPFNPEAIIPVKVDQAGLLVVDVVDVQGRVVQGLHRAAVQPGTMWIHWDATGLRSGLYFIRARMGGESQTIKMTVLR
jgi:aminopeptidase N